MALILLNQTTCAICNKSVSPKKDYIVAPNFSQNTLDPFFFFSGNPFHVECLNTHKHGAKVHEYITLIKDKENKQVCEISNQPFEDIDKFISFGLLCSDMNEPISKFNFFVCNKTNLPIWKEQTYFLSVLRDFKQSGKWRSFSTYNWLDFLDVLVGSCGEKSYRPNAPVIITTQ